MNYSEVKKELKKEFESFLKPLGYKSKSGAQGCEFILLKELTTFRIGYGVANYIDEFTTGCYLGIGILPIQKIVYKLEDVKEVTDNYGSTIASGISHYFNELNYDYRIKTTENIKEWGAIVRKFYEEYAIPFLEKYNTVDAIDKLVNTNPSERVIYCDDLAWRMMNGLISAKLNNNPKYEDLKSYYRAEVERIYQGHFKYSDCIKVIEFLDSHSQEELLKITEVQKAH